MMKKTDSVEHAIEIRKDILKMTYNTQGSHIGCSLGIVDILVVLYFTILKISPQKPGWIKRDRFLLSKGHACTALYATLARRGFFSRKLLDNYCVDGSKIAAHVTLNSLPGIESTAGSLGHGLSIGIGMAISLRNKGYDSKVYVLVGDAECQEGSIWEAIMFAGHHKLDNLILIIDNNDLQTLDTITNILNLNPFDKKLKAFGWNCETVDGHNFDHLQQALKKNQAGKPYAIVAKTIKGKGISFMENGLIWHGKAPNEEEYHKALKELSLTDPKK